MNLIICIDDTDNLTSKGTGTIADELCAIITKDFGGECSFVSRHQLLIHKDIEYTSHNSSMCFLCKIESEKYEDVKKACIAHVKQESAEGSDPGIAIAIFDTMDTDLLISYGKDCKRKIMSKELAYNTAEKAGVFLTELGGTGIGVIGALAGIGLRVWGNDGTLKGKIKELEEDHYHPVSEILNCKFVKHVTDKNGIPLSKTDLVYIPPKAKPALVNGELTLLTEKEADFENKYLMLSKESIKNYGTNMIFKEGCEAFSFDVEEEQVDNTTSCFNCRFRRWLENGLIMCSKEKF